MEELTNVLLLMLSAVLAENFIFVKFLGICPFLGVSEKPDTALGMGFAVTFVMTISSAATWGIYHAVLVPARLEYLKTIAFILIIAALVQFIEMFLKKFLPSLYQALGIYTWCSTVEHSERLQLHLLLGLRFCGGRRFYACHCYLRGRARKTCFCGAAESLCRHAACSDYSRPNRHGVFRFFRNELFVTKIVLPPRRIGQL